NDRPGADPAVTGYNVWRRMDAPATKASGGMAGEAARAFLERELARATSAPVRLSSEQAAAIGFPPGAWESVGFHAATRADAYDLLAPTRNDSTARDESDQSFVVTVHLTNPDVIGITEPTTGHSVDNLPPGIPAPFAGQSLSNGMMLHWGR